MGRRVCGQRPRARHGKLDPRSEARRMGEPRAANLCGRGGARRPANNPRGGRKAENHGPETGRQSVFRARICPCEAGVAVWLFRSAHKAAPGPRHMAGLLDDARGARRAVAPLRRNRYNGRGGLRPRQCFGHHPLHTLQQRRHRRGARSETLGHGRERFPCLRLSVDGRWAELLC